VLCGPGFVVAELCLHGGMDALQEAPVMFLSQGFRWTREENNSWLLKDGDQSTLIEDGTIYSIYMLIMLEIDIHIGLPH